MNGIFDTAVNAFRVESIRKRLLYTFMILGIFMLGGLVPVPGMDGEKFTALVRRLRETLEADSDTLVFEIKERGDTQAENFVREWVERYT